MEQTDYLDFDLMIEAGDDGYTARVVQSPAGEARVVFTRPFTDLELENFVLNVGQTRRGVRRIGSPQWEAALRFGTRLYDTVFADDVGTAFQMSLNEAQDAGKGLRVRLRLSAVPELASIPWEYLYSDALGSFLTLLTDTPLVRFIDLPHSVEALTVAPPLTVLVVVSDPTDIAVLDVAQEKEKLRQALAKPIEEGRIQLRFLDDARLTSLRDALSENDVHVLHFIGHGGFDGKEGVVAFENDAGTSRMVTSATLAMLLQNFSTLCLVVLNACEGARNSAQDPFAGVAQALVRGRIPAVIAMQFEITDSAAIAFCHEFYKAIAKGQPVDTACARGRLALLGEGNDVEWGTPVLYLRAPNGRVFDVAPLPQIDPGKEIDPEKEVMPPRPRGRWPILAGGIAASLLALVAFLVLRPDNGPPPTDTTTPIETTVALQTSTSSETVPAGTAAAGIVRASEPPTIDGDDAEWAALSGAVITSLFHCGTSVWSTPADYEALWRLAWDDRNLYLLAIITDDIGVRTPAATAEILRGDTITISMGTGPGQRGQALVGDGFATCPDRANSRDLPDPGEPGFPLESDFHLAFIPDGEEVAIWFIQGGEELPFTGAIDPSAITAEAVELGGGSFRLEAAVPWTAIGISGRPDELALRLEGRDEDGEAQGHDTLVSNAPGSVTKNTATWLSSRSSRNEPSSLATERQYSFPE